MEANSIYIETIVNSILPPLVISNRFKKILRGVFSVSFSLYKSTLLEALIWRMIFIILDIVIKIETLRHSNYYIIVYTTRYIKIWISKIIIIIINE